MFGANFPENQSVKMADFVVIFEGKFCQILVGFGPSDQHFNVFLTGSSFALSTTVRPRNETMAKALTSWLVPNFHNIIYAW